jgi:glutamate 5-kinase
LISEARGLRQAIGGASVSATGTGGIATKLAAAEEAAAAGIPTIIASGMQNSVLEKIFDARNEIGTLILPEVKHLRRKKHWIGFNLRPVGTIVVNEGAYQAVADKGKSLLPAGVEKVEGSFGVGDCVRIDFHGKEFARGLVNYGKTELNRIKGLHTSKIEKVLGYKAHDEVIHRDDLVIL